MKCAYEKVNIRQKRLGPGRLTYKRSCSWSISKCETYYLKFTVSCRSNRLKEMRRQFIFYFDPYQTIAGELFPLEYSGLKFYLFAYEVSSVAFWRQPAPFFVFPCLRFALAESLLSSAALVVLLLLTAVMSFQRGGPLDSPRSLLLISELLMFCEQCKFINSTSNINQKEIHCIAFLWWSEERDKHDSALILGNHVGVILKWSATSFLPQ